MTNYKSLINAANALKSLASSPEEGEFWAGYLRGVRRAEHGEKFGTAEEHTLWLTLADDIDVFRRARGLGYRAGLNLDPPLTAVKILTQWHCLRCDYSWESRDGLRPICCAACKSPYWDRPRRK